MKRLAKSLLGVLSLAMGVAILGWCAYSLIVRNDQFRFRVANIPGLLIPILFIWFGWRWLRGERASRKRFTSELTLTLKLSDTEFGTGPEREGVLDLKHRLESRLEGEDVGEIDGEEFGGGECSIFIHTDAPDRAEIAVRTFLTSEARPLDYSLARSEL